MDEIETSEKQLHDHWNVIINHDDVFDILLNQTEDWTC